MMHLTSLRLLRQCRKAPQLRCQVRQLRQRGRAQLPRALQPRRKAPRDRHLPRQQELRQLPTLAEVKQIQGSIACDRRAIMPMMATKASVGDAMTAVSLSLSLFRLLFLSLSLSLSLFAQGAQLKLWLMQCGQPLI